MLFECIFVTWAKGQYSPIDIELAISGQSPVQEQDQEGFEELDEV